MLKNEILSEEKRLAGAKRQHQDGLKRRLKKLGAFESELAMCKEALEAANATFKKHVEAKEHQKAEEFGRRIERLRAQLGELKAKVKKAKGRR